MSWPIVLNYEKGKTSRRRKVLQLVVLAGLVCSAWVIGQAALSEWKVRQIEQRLLAANKPAVLWKGTAIAFTPSGDFVLPDGTRARLIEVDITKALIARMNTDVTFALQRLQTKSLGHTIVRYDTDGTPLVQVWVLSPSAYNGMCGNSTSEERREGRMLLWRNLGAWLCDRSAWPMSDFGATCPVSVMGY